MLAQDSAAILHKADALLQKADVFYGLHSQKGDSLALLCYSEVITLLEKHRIKNSRLADAYRYAGDTYYDGKQQYSVALDYYQHQLAVLRQFPATRGDYFTPYQ